MKKKGRKKTDPANIVIHVDSASAYNTVNRALMLESVYADQRLMHTWRAFSFCYSRPSLLLLRENGVLVDTIDSEQGVRQGCVLGGLGYANALQPAYAACALGRDSTTVRAIMDDLAICGPPAQAFAAYANYVEMASARGVEVNQRILLPQITTQALPPALLAFSLAKARPGPDGKCKKV